VLDRMARREFLLVGLLSWLLSRCDGQQTDADDGHGVDDAHDDGHHEHHSDQFGQVLIFFFTVGLCLGAITDFTLSRFGIKVAYNVVMFFEGIFFGFLLNNLFLGRSLFSFLLFLSDLSPQSHSQIQ
jgi:hypothetical protein